MVLCLIGNFLKLNDEDLLTFQIRPYCSNIMVSKSQHRSPANQSFDLLDDLIIVDAALEHFRKVKTLKKTKLKSSKLKRIVDCIKINSDLVHSRWKKLKTWLKETEKTSKKSPHKLNVRKTEIQDYWESQL